MKARDAIDTVSERIESLRRDLEATGRKLEAFGEALSALQASLDGASTVTMTMFDPIHEPPTVLEFPIVGPKGPTWRLRQTQVDEWAKIYPGIDVLQECRKAWGWCDSHPAQRKTAKGMPAFLNSWLSRAQDHGRPGNGTNATARYLTPDEQRQHRRIESQIRQASEIPWVCPHVDRCNSQWQCRTHVALARPMIDGARFELDEHGTPRSWNPIRR